MGAMDKKMANTEARSQEREVELKSRTLKHVAKAEATTSQAQLKDILPQQSQVETCLHLRIQIMGRRKELHKQSGFNLAISGS